MADDDRAKRAKGQLSFAVLLVLDAVSILLVVLLMFSVCRALGFLPRGWPALAPEPMAYLAGAFYLIAGIQVALSEAYEQGLRYGSACVEHPPMRLDIDLAKMPIGRVVPRIRDDLGRALPMVAGVTIVSQVEPLDRVTVEILVDGDRVRLVSHDGKAEPHGS